MNTAYSVSQLNQLVAGTLERDIGTIWVEGEISNLTRAASGHLYFSLKDSQAQVSCALFKNARYQLKMAWDDIQNGIAIRAYARVSLYQPRGTYQIIIQQVEPAGLGHLERAFQERKAALAAEGLFDATRKKAIPALPRRIGLITSPSGAAVHDAITTLKRRYPLIPLIIYPSLVQGDSAPAQLIGQIQTANRRQECDVLLLIRGGGSLEDLWAFNDPELIRTIATSHIPIISGVGHEIDVTLADFAADLRAPTPTAAAEQAVPVLAEIRQRYEQRLAQINQRMVNMMIRRQQSLDILQHRLQQQSPIRYLHTQMQRCDELAQRLSSTIRRSLSQQSKQLAQLQARLTLHPLTRQLKSHQQQLDRLEQRLTHRIISIQQQRQQQLQYLMQALHNLSPLNILARGYAVTYDEHKQVIKHAQAVAVGSRIQVQLQEGRLHCEVKRRTKK